MLIVGLTGSIGMGKSTAAAHFRANDIAVCDADRIVHDLYEGEASGLVEKAFPGSTITNKAGVRIVDRQRLGQMLQADETGFARLETIIHPLVREKERDFLKEQFDAGAAMAVLEIPLLFETGADQLVDTVIVVSAPAAVQRERVLQRPGMSSQKLENLLARQIKDEDKRKRADFIVDTSETIAQSRAQLDKIITELLSLDATAYQKYWA